MGYCEIDGRPTEDGIIVTKGECIKQGGTWVGEGGCFVRNVLTRSLGDAILEVAQTYPLTVDFRDQVLATCEVGRHFIELYEQSLEMTFQTVRANYPLVAEFIETWLASVPLVRAILETNGEGEWAGRSECVARIRFDDRLHARVTALLEAFRQSAATPEYAEVLDEVAAELKLYAGATPGEILDIIRRER